MTDDRYAGSLFHEHFGTVSFVEHDDTDHLLPLGATRRPGDTPETIACRNMFLAVVARAFMDAFWMPTGNTPGEFEIKQEAIDWFEDFEAVTEVCEMCDLDAVDIVKVFRRGAADPVYAAKIRHGLKRVFG